MTVLPVPVQPVEPPTNDSGASSQPPAPGFAHALADAQDRDNTRADKPTSPSSPAPTKKAAPANSEQTPADSNPGATPVTGPAPLPDATVAALLAAIEGLVGQPESQSAAGPPTTAADAAAAATTPGTPTTPIVATTTTLTDSIAVAANAPGAGAAPAPKTTVAPATPSAPAPTTATTPTPGEPHPPAAAPPAPPALPAPDTAATDAHAALANLPTVPAAPSNLAQVGAHTPTKTEAIAPPTAPIVGTPATARAESAASTAAAPAAPAPTQASPTPPDPAEQLVTVLRPLARGADGSYHLQIELRPPELGRVDLRVELRDGVLHTSIHAEHAQTAELMRNALDDLRARLDADGVRSGALTVGSGGADADGRDSEASPKSPDADGADAVTTLARGSDPTATDPDALLDVRI